jgi:hypothetical protein
MRRRAHPADLAVGCNGRRLFLVVPMRSHRVEAVGRKTLKLHPTQTVPAGQDLFRGCPAGLVL